MASSKSAHTHTRMDTHMHTQNGKIQTNPSFHPLKWDRGSVDQRILEPADLLLGGVMTPLQPSEGHLTSEVPPNPPKYPATHSVLTRRLLLKPELGTLTANFRISPQRVFDPLYTRTSPHCKKKSALSLHVYLIFSNYISNV